MIRKASALSALALALGVVIAGCARDASITGSVTDASDDYLPHPALRRSKVVAVPDTTSTMSADSVMVVDTNSTVLSAPERVQVMNRLTALPADVTVTGVIGREGGYLQIPDAGVWLFVPKGAVRKDVTFSVTAVAGPIVAYEFEPHGVTFETPLYIVQSIYNTTPESSDPNLFNFEGGHFQSRGDLDGATNGGVVNEVMPVYVNAKQGWVAFAVKHFSGYLLASGRR